MSEKAPQSTGMLVHRLRRVAKWFDREADNHVDRPNLKAAFRARANTCWQAAARLEECAEQLERRLA